MKMMQNGKNRFFYHTQNPRYGQKKSLSAEKMVTFLAPIFNDFYFAVSASENDAKRQKHNSLNQYMDKNCCQQKKKPDFKVVFFFFVFFFFCCERI